MSALTFYKMTGSGNDFIFFDTRSDAESQAQGRTPGSETLETPESIARLCARGTGVGADGVVFLYAPEHADIGIRYYNSDGSTASLCGNATLCTANLAGILGGVNPDGFTILTDAGKVRARLREGLPEFDFPLAADVKPDFSAISRESGERRLGYVTASIPHVVILVDDLEQVDIVGRGRPVRNHPSLPHGANVNFVARRPNGGWAIRTYERGVEDETLACGTGNVASAILLREWGEVSGDEVELLTKSGKTLTVRLCRDTDGWLPSLRGEGRLVFLGELAST